jgi:hypothetical protein
MDASEYVRTALEKYNEETKRAVEHMLPKTIEKL